MISVTTLNETLLAHFIVYMMPRVSIGKEGRLHIDHGSKNGPCLSGLYYFQFKVNLCTLESQILNFLLSILEQRTIIPHFIQHSHVGYGTG